MIALHPLTGSDLHGAARDARTGPFLPDELQAAPVNTLDISTRGGGYTLTLRHLSGATLEARAKNATPEQVGFVFGALNAACLDCGFAKTAIDVALIGAQLLKPHQDRRTELNEAIDKATVDQQPGSEWWPATSELTKSELESVASDMLGMSYGQRKKDAVRFKVFNNSIYRHRGEIKEVAE